MTSYSDRGIVPAKRLPFVQLPLIITADGGSGQLCVQLYGLAILCSLRPARQFCLTYIRVSGEFVHLRFCFFLRASVSD